MRSMQMCSLAREGGGALSIPRDLWCRLHTVSFNYILVFISMFMRYSQMSFRNRPTGAAGIRHDAMLFHRFRLPQRPPVPNDRLSCTQCCSRHCNTFVPLLVYPEYTYHDDFCIPGTQSSVSDRPSCARFPTDSVSLGCLRR